MMRDFIIVDHAIVNVNITQLSAYTKVYFAIYDSLKYLTMSSKWQGAYCYRHPTLATV